ncbi:MAG: rRNA maturation RNase YbeY [Planctomycetes bacterium]|nr:rRNA maturation RNase YbeY [Planctomycetota bacterium]
MTARGAGRSNKASARQARPERRKARAPAASGGVIDIAWDGVRRSVTDARVREAADLARRHGRAPQLSLSIVFVTDEALARMHGVHLADPTPTDVITFDLTDEIGGVSGELYVSAERARIVARRRKVVLQRELLLYVVHGVLHLCGFDDHAPADRKRMRAAENAVMKRLGFEPDRLPHDD